MSKIKHVLIPCIMILIQYAAVAQNLGFDVSPSDCYVCGSSSSWVTLSYKSYDANTNEVTLEVRQRDNLTSCDPGGSFSSGGTAALKDGSGNYITLNNATTYQKSYVANQTSVQLRFSGSLITSFTNITAEVVSNSGQTYLTGTLTLDPITNPPGQHTTAIVNAVSPLNVNDLSVLGSFDNTATHIRYHIIRANPNGTMPAWSPYCGFHTPDFNNSAPTPNSTNNIIYGAMSTLSPGVYFFSTRVGTSSGSSGPIPYKAEFSTPVAFPHVGANATDIQTIINNLTPLNNGIDVYATFSPNMGSFNPFPASTAYAVRAVKTNLLNGQQPDPLNGFCTTSPCNNSYIGNITAGDIVEATGTLGPNDLTFTHTLTGLDPNESYTVIARAWASGKTAYYGIGTVTTLGTSNTNIQASPINCAVLSNMPVFELNISNANSIELDVDRSPGNSSTWQDHYNATLTSSQWQVIGNKIVINTNNLNNWPSNTNATGNRRWRVNIDGSGFTTFQDYCQGQCLNTTICGNSGSGNNSNNGSVNNPVELLFDNPDLKQNDNDVYTKWTNATDERIFTLQNDGDQAFFEFNIAHFSWAIVEMKVNHGAADMYLKQNAMPNVGWYDIKSEAKNALTDVIRIDPSGADGKGFNGGYTITENSDNITADASVIDNTNGNYQVRINATKPNTEVTIRVKYIMLQMPCAGDDWRINGLTYYPGNTYHGAIDLAYNNCQTMSVLASAAGRVSDIIDWNNLAGIPGGLGNAVTIDHGYGYKTTYGHMRDNPDASLLNAEIDKAKVIGQQGNTGNAIGVTGNHIHLEILKGGYELQLTELSTKNGVETLVLSGNIDGISLDPIDGMISQLLSQQSIVSDCQEDDGMALRMDVPGPTSVNVYGHGITIVSYATYNRSGIKIEDHQFNSGVTSFVLDLQNYNIGQYYILLAVDQNGRIYSHPFIK